MPPDLGPPPRLGYVQSALERLAERREDATFLAELEASGESRAHVIGGELVVLRKIAGGHEPFFSCAQARELAGAVDTIFLGLDKGSGCFGIGISQADAEALKAREDLFVTDLRSIAVQGLVAPEHLPPLAEAKALLHWHARHPRCSVCGEPTQAVQAGWRRDCPQCKAQHFPRTDPVVIMLAIADGHCLLGRQTRFVANTWSCLAGFIEPGESIEEAVRRETLEEAGICCGRVHYFASQPWPFPASLMIGCHAEAITREIAVDKSELEDARWFSRDEAAAMLTRTHGNGLITPPPVAIAHHIIRAWVEHGDRILG